MIDPGAGAYCLGLMGSSKFCLRRGGSGGCSVAAHARKFTPVTHMAYLKENETRALCSPNFDMQKLSPAQVLRLQGVQLALSEWETLFNQVQVNNPPKWLAFESPAAEGWEVKPALVQIVDQEVMSPMAYETSGGFLGTIPMLSFDESISSSGSHDRDEMDAEVLTS